MVCVALHTSRRDTVQMYKLFRSIVQINERWNSVPRTVLRATLFLADSATPWSFAPGDWEQGSILGI
jgi:hypothetical protein